jgi:adenylate cyclase
MSEGAKRRLLALLSGDVAGYSRLMAADEDYTIRQLAQRRELVSSLIVAHSGRLVDFAGDNFLAEFGRVVRAVNCALAIQHTFAMENRGPDVDRRVQFRSGAHVGEVRIEGERLFGDTVNIAARREGAAEADGIGLSRQTLEQVSNHVAVEIADGARRMFKNIVSPVRAYSIGAATIAQLEAPSARIPPTRGETAGWRRRRPSRCCRSSIWRRTPRGGSG